MLNVKNIVLTQQELQQCMEFSSKSAPTQQSIEFGQITTKARSTSEIARDNLIGKIAEIAFAKMLKENYGIDVPLDFNYYPRGKWDDQDAVINGWRIDVKGTRKGRRWMLLEWNKLNFRQRGNNLSHLYVMFSVSWDRKTDKPTGEVSYEGAVSLKKLCKGCATTIELTKGTILPGTHTILQADNYGIEFKHLYKHLNHLVDYVTSHEPPSALTDNYRNPYTELSTLEIIDSIPSSVEQAPHDSNDQLNQEVTPNGIFAKLRNILNYIPH